MSGAAARAAGPISKFSYEGIKKSWELFPLLIITTFHAIGTTSFVYWMCNTRDVQFNRRRKAINERVDLLEPWPLKLLVMKYGPQPLPELHSIYRTMDEESARRETEAEEARKLSKSDKSKKKPSRKG